MLVFFNCKILNILLLKRSDLQNLISPRNSAFLPQNAFHNGRERRKKALRHFVLILTPQKNILAIILLTHCLIVPYDIFTRRRKKTLRFLIQAVYHRVLSAICLNSDFFWKREDQDSYCNWSIIKQSLIFILACGGKI